MPQFHPLTVTDIQKTTRDAVVLTLKAEARDFDFIQGQYLTFRHDFGGVKLRRSYSICSGRDEDVLQVGIKRVDGGAFSTWANQELQVGDVVQAMAPAGRFYTKLNQDAAKNYLAFAVGSGITPVLSTLKTILHAEPKSTFTLVYANRAVASIMFRDELEDLKNRYMERLTLIHILKSDVQNTDMFTGRIDAEKCKLLFQHLINVSRIDAAFICGPEPVIQVVSGALQAQGLAKSNIKYELFSSEQSGRAHQKAAIMRATLPGGSTATVTLDGVARSFSIQPGQSLLEAGLANDIDLPYACKAGVCSTCRCKVISGKVEMLANHALEDYEVEKGYVLACQSHPLTAEIIVDYDK